MTVFKPLTDHDVDQYRLNSEFVRYLELFRGRYGLEKGEVRVLDWGCGRGEAVARLRQLGYNAAEADIDAETIENGRRYFATAGTPGDASCLHLIESGGRLSDVPDGSFDFVLSETVLEHVVDLDTVARELGRLTATPGAGLHVFPPRRGVVEQHLHMPFIHWLPKNRVRRVAMHAYVLAGVEPKWVEEGVHDKVQRYYDYSLQHTFYRPTRTLRDTFQRHGFQSRFVAAEHPRIAQHRVLGSMRRPPGLHPALNWALTTFKVVEMLLEKRGGA